MPQTCAPRAWPCRDGSASCDRSTVRGARHDGPRARSRSSAATSRASSTCSTSGTSTSSRPPAPSATTSSSAWSPTRSSRRSRASRRWSPCGERMEIVAALRDVDEVVIDVHSDKFESWQDLRYDVIFKGDDWKDTPRGVKLEADLAQVGARVALLPLHPAHLEHAAARRPRHPLRRDRLASRRPDTQPPRHDRSSTSSAPTGCPAAYGGFETAAQEVGLFLRDRGLGRRRLLPAAREGPDDAGRVARADPGPRPRAARGLARHRRLRPHLRAPRPRARRRPTTCA